MGCSSKPKEEKESRIPSTGMQWTTKALVKDLKENKSHSLSIDIIAASHQLRMEVTAILGYPIASLVTNPSEVRMALYPQKKFYIGSNSEGALRNMMNFPIDPRNLGQLITDQPLKGWTCEMGADKLVSRCTRKGDLLVVWSDRTPETKKVIIRSPTFEMEWLFQDKEPLANVSIQQFQLEPPKGYKIINF